MAKFEITEELLSQIENLQMLLKNNGTCLWFKMIFQMSIT